MLYLTETSLLIECVIKASRGKAPWRMQVVVVTQHISHYGISFQNKAIEMRYLEYRVFKRRSAFTPFDITKPIKTPSQLCDQTPTVDHLDLTALIMMYKFITTRYSILDINRLKLAADCSDVILKQHRLNPKVSDQPIIFMRAFQIQFVAPWLFSQN